MIHQSASLNTTTRIRNGSMSILRDHSTELVPPWECREGRRREREPPLAVGDGRDLLLVEPGLDLVGNGLLHVGSLSERGGEGKAARQGSGRRETGQFLVTRSRDLAYLLNRDILPGDSEPLKA